MGYRIFKYTVSITTVAFLSLVYVHQQLEVVKLSYAIEKKEKKLEELLDRKQKLEYNINNLQSPARLEKLLMAKKIDMSFPKERQIVAGMNASAGNMNNASLRAMAVERRESRFSILELFGLRAEAQAREK